MRKYNYNSITFILVLIIIVAGWISLTLLEGIKDSVEKFLKEPNVSTFVDDVDSASKEISYKGILIDINSYIERKKGTRVVEKSDATVVLLDNGYLAFDNGVVDEETLNEMAQSAKALNDVADEVGATFLYTIAPTKSYFCCYPTTESNGFRESVLTYESILQNNNIKTLNLGNQMDVGNISMEEAFFITDHHWKPETGLWATAQICEYLNTNHGFRYDRKKLDADNYEILSHCDSFLGSQGKKVGRYFSPLGLDEINLIVPKFDTELVVSDTSGKYDGRFDETVIRKEKFDTSNLYYSNPYVAYSGGDYPLQIIKNNSLPTEGNKILVLRDSFGCVVTPFLSLVAREVHTIDVRHWCGTENAQNIKEYIRLEKPDYIIILYSDLIPTMLDFDKN